MPEFGRYGVFVWPAYGVSALVLVVAIAQSVLRARRWRRAAEASETAEPRASVTKRA